MKLNKQQLTSLSKEYIKLFLLYAVIQTLVFVLGWSLYNGFRNPNNYVPISKWPDWYMCLLSIPIIYYVIKYKVEKGIANGKY